MDKDRDDLRAYVFDQDAASVTKSDGNVKKEEVVAVWMTGRALLSLLPGDSLDCEPRTV